MPLKTPISKADSYEKIGKFWDEHDSSEIGGQNVAIFTVNIQSEKRCQAIDDAVIHNNTEFQTDDEQ